MGRQGRQGPCAPHWPHCLQQVSRVSTSGHGHILVSLVCLKALLLLSLLAVGLFPATALNLRTRKQILRHHACAIRAQAEGQLSMSGRSPMSGLGRTTAVLFLSYAAQLLP